MLEENISSAFLRDNAAKHFLCLSYKAARPGQAPSVHFASCFVVKIDEHWFLCTAGHVVNGLKAALASGITLTEFSLQDKLAGNDHPFGVPYPFNAEDWMVIDDDAIGVDFAATQLSALLVDNLRAGGVKAIEETAWGPPPLDLYRPWLLAGIPSETYSKVGNKHIVKLTIMPLLPSAAPVTSASTNTAAKVFGALVEQPDLDGASVDDIDGMSGAPVFGIKEVDDGLRYWLIGVQSSWYPTSRIVAFCPILPILDALKIAIRRVQDGNAG
ncbi:hypothetical protein [Ralstonia sp. 1B3]|uniref:hypothetical protein n=1 Tax=Ralstonia sp. 1B3 TaxID=2997421 RepID=UPI002FCAE353